MENLIGKRIPEFKLNAYHDGKFITVSDKDVLGKWGVLFFYPADFTFVCPTELADLADNYDRFKALNTEIYSVSVDSHFVHKAWADASDTIKQVKFPMLADVTFKLARNFGVMVEEEGQALRGTFVFDPEGIVRVYEVHDMGIGRNAEELVRKIEAAQFVAENGGEVCPAKWHKGAKTLKPSIDLVGKI